ncbi:MAG: ribonuclease P protein component [Planctomycetia bacterium]|nr:ribonuclease P protein component [Planctomycetia bacterium]
MTGHGLPARYRLRRQTDFERVYAGRISIGDGVLRIYGLKSECPHPRLGLSVSRRVGGAVVRNRYKRLLREAFRLARQNLPALDLVVIPAGRGRPDLAQFQESLVRLAARLAERVEGSGIE